MRRKNGKTNCRYQVLYIATAVLLLYDADYPVALLRGAPALDVGPSGGFTATMCGSAGRNTSEGGAVGSAGFARLWASAAAA